MLAAVEYKDVVALRESAKRSTGAGAFCANYVSHEMRVSLLFGLLLSACGIWSSCACAIEPWLRDPASSATTEANAIERIPLNRMMGQAQENIRSVVDRPSYFRRLPTQTVECDPDLFILLVRHPEIIVNIWDLMGITKVEVKRIAPYVFTGQDGAGTACRCELLYGTPDVHVYYGSGAYSGSLSNKDVNGRCVCVLHSSTSTNRDGRSLITVSMDVFMKLDSFGADLLTRTLSPLVSKTADYNFIESAKFVSQLNELCEENPLAAAQLAERMNRVDPSVRAKFSQVVANIGASSPQAIAARETISDPKLLFKQSPSPKMTSTATDAEAGKATQGPSATRSSRTASTAHANSAESRPGRPVEQRPIEQRPMAAATLSDGGVVMPVKPPVSLRR